MPVHDIRLSRPDVPTATEVRATRPDQTLPLRRQDGRMIIDPPTLQLFELLVIDERSV
ncbi:MAG: hypothetical protein J2P17_12475 [Mycobacterium sp.]|nr:hypothetical protein [Mycobacterium sp.]